jgi:hypothetical protein
VKYVNPGHPCGELHPQEGGFLRGAGGFRQASDRPEFSVKGKTSTQHPSQIPLLNYGGHMGESIAPKRPR